MAAVWAQSAQGAVGGKATSIFPPISRCCREIHLCPMLRLGEDALRSPTQGRQRPPSASGACRDSPATWLGEFCPVSCRTSVPDAAGTMEAVAGPFHGLCRHLPPGPGSFL